MELEAFSDPGCVLVPHFSGQHRPLMELVTLLNINIDPVNKLILKEFSVEFSLLWTLILHKLDVDKALKSQETAPIVERFSIFFFPCVVPILQDRASMINSYYVIKSK